MKVLKSGIEMTPSQLKKLRGGACACGCGIGFDGENYNVSADESDSCDCACITPPIWNAYSGNYGGANNSLNPHFPTP